MVGHEVLDLSIKNSLLRFKDDESHLNLLLLFCAEVFYIVAKVLSSDCFALRLYLYICGFRVADIIGLGRILKVGLYLAGLIYIALDID